MSGPDGTAAGPVRLDTFPEFVHQHEVAAQEELGPHEFFRVVVWTTEGRIKAIQIEGERPDWLIVHGVRRVRWVTVIAAIESVQISIERDPRALMEKPRYLGFRIPG